MIGGAGQRAPASPWGPLLGLGLMLSAGPASASEAPRHRIAVLMAVKDFAPSPDLVRPLRWPIHDLIDMYEALETVSGFNEIHVLAERDALLAYAGLASEEGCRQAPASSSTVCRILVRGHLWEAAGKEAPYQGGVVGSLTPPTRDGTLDLLSSLSGWTDADTDLLFYASTHGTVQDFRPTGRFGDWRLDDEQILIFASDTQIYELGGLHFPTDALTQADILAVMDDLPPRQKVILKDLCQTYWSPRVQGQIKALERASRGAVELSRATTSRRTTVISAARVGEPSHEVDELENGVYTWYFLKALGSLASSEGEGAPGEARGACASNQVAVSGRCVRFGDLNGDGAITLFEAHRSATVATHAFTEETFDSAQTAQWDDHRFGDPAPFLLAGELKPGSQGIFVPYMPPIYVDGMRRALSKRSIAPPAEPSIKTGKHFGPPGADAEATPGEAGPPPPSSPGAEAAPPAPSVFYYLIEGPRRGERRRVEVTSESITELEYVDPGWVTISAFQDDHLIDSAQIKIQRGSVISPEDLWPRFRSRDHLSVTLGAAGWAEVDSPLAVEALTLGYDRTWRSTPRGGSNLDLGLRLRFGLDPRCWDQPSASPWAEDTPPDLQDGSCVIATTRDYWPWSAALMGSARYRADFILGPGTGSVAVGALGGILREVDRQRWVKGMLPAWGPQLVFAYSRGGRWWAVATADALFARGDLKPAAGGGEGNHAMVQVGLGVERRY